MGDACEEDKGSFLLITSLSDELSSLKWGHKSENHLFLKILEAYSGNALKDLNI